ncbi:hypothetical protein LEQ_0062c [Ligilactobacillus equi DPC 6820]|uniref:Uncharacterized protein n=1 Tax=Ligilactobacillus equi DPC 6820 TaxID=1392007 RepID=V7HU57_9LACO|nr:hypothetical protein LEQ_0062c [Ligilactobacillus equi DPC 6820]
MCGIPYVCRGGARPKRLIAWVLRIPYVCRCGPLSAQNFSNHKKVFPIRIGAPYGGKITTAYVE